LQQILHCHLVIIARSD